jgi:hypothetical protein
MSNRPVVSEGRFVARHSLPRGRHVRYVLPQPVTRHAAGDDALAVAGSAPVRRGIAVAAVIGGALSAAGSAVATAPPPPEPADPAAIGLAAESKRDRADDDENEDEDDDRVLDSDALAKTVKRAGEEGRRLAAENRESRDDADAESDSDADSGSDSGSASDSASDAAPAAGSAPGASATSRAAQPAGGDRTASRFPGELIDTDDWYLTLPTGKEGSPDTVDGSELATYHSKFFALNDSRDGIVFTANAGGATTSGSKFPRSELREMQGTEKASWDGRKGTHTMELDQAITATPDAKPDVIAGQIHATSDDLMQIHLSGTQLTVKYGDGKKKVLLDDDYRLGTRFTTKIESSGGRVKVWYNGAPKADLAISSPTSYFKAGAYVNSNTRTGDDAGATGQVVIYRADVTHR